MNRVHNINKEQIINFLKENKTTKEIGNILNISKSTISKFIRDNKLQEFYYKPKYDKFILNQINNKELSYLIGFIIADGAINKENVEISISKTDIEIIEFISNILKVPYRIDDSLNKEKKRFPRVRINRKIQGINKFLGGEKKVDRNVPIISKSLEVYMIRGIFDADGCITWGYRKDRNRLWHKVSFTSSQKILIAVQKILYKINISTIVRPKTNENCYVLEFANKKDIIKFYNYLYEDKDFIVLKRKFNNYKALRLELGEFNETI